MDGHCSATQRVGQAWFLTTHVGSAPACAGKFDDPAVEIAKLSELIKQDIQALNVGLVDLQNLSAASKAANKQSSSHSHTIVDSLRLRLKDATKDFQNVLQTRKESLERNKARQQQFSSAATPDRQPLFNAPRSGTGLSPRQPATIVSFIQLLYDA